MTILHHTNLKLASLSLSISPLFPSIPRRREKLNINYTYTHNCLDNCTSILAKQVIVTNVHRSTTPILSITAVTGAKDHLSWELDRSNSSISKSLYTTPLLVNNDSQYCSYTHTPRDVGLPTHLTALHDSQRTKDLA